MWRELHYWIRHATTQYCILLISSSHHDVDMKNISRWLYCCSLPRSAAAAEEEGMSPQLYHAYLNILPHQKGTFSEVYYERDLRTLD